MDKSMFTQDAALKELDALAKTGMKSAKDPSFLQRPTANRADLFPDTGWWSKVSSMTRLSSHRGCRHCRMKFSTRRLRRGEKFSRFSGCLAGWTVLNALVTTNDLKCLNSISIAGS
jgi:hypothetical protein